MSRLCSSSFFITSFTVSVYSGSQALYVCRPSIPIVVMNSALINSGERDSLWMSATIAQFCHSCFHSFPFETASVTNVKGSGGFALKFWVVAILYNCRFVLSVAADWSKRCHTNAVILLVERNIVIRVTLYTTNVETQRHSVLVFI